MIFEAGKTYQHTTGKRMTIIGRLKTHTYGECLIGEHDTGELVPVGECADGWHESEDKIFENYEEPKTGHWIFTKTKIDRYGCTAECASCHKKWKTYDEIRFKKEHNYCPNCGCCMVEPQESEDKE